MTAPVYAFEFTTLDGSKRSLADFQGQVLLIVNTASRCGFTPQYQGLEQLYQKYRERGFAVIGFPCNQFGHQEPLSEAEIVSFCFKNYGVSFPLSTKVEVNGKNAHPLFGYLTQSLPGFMGSTSIKWNFTKFLVDREGKPFRRFASLVTPEKIAVDIEKLLV